SVTFTALRQARINHRRQQRHPDGEKDPWGRDLDERTVLLAASWRFAGIGHATTAERQLALAAAARAREHDRIAREETWTNGPQGEPTAMEKRRYLPHQADDVRALTQTHT